jgi:hypothetical protein
VGRNKTEEQIGRKKILCESAKIKIKFSWSERRMSGCNFNVGMQHLVRCGVKEDI